MHSSALITVSRHLYHFASLSLDETADDSHLYKSKLLQELKLVDTQQEEDSLLRIEKEKIIGSESDEKIVLNYLERLSAHFDQRTCIVDSGSLDRLFELMIHLVEAIVQNASAYFAVKQYAIQKLAECLWTAGHASSAESLKQKALFILENLLCNPAFDKNVAHELFHKIATVSEQNSTLRAVLPIYLKHLSSKDTSLEVKLELAQYMPKASEQCQNLITKKELYLFHFMMQMICDEEQPLALKEVFLKHIVSFYQFQNAKKQLAKLDESLNSLEGLLRHPAIKNNDLLEKIIKSAMRQILYQKMKNIAKLRARL
jgi:hypothetical protein